MQVANKRLDYYKFSNQQLLGYSNCLILQKVLTLYRQHCFNFQHFYTRFALNQYCKSQPHLFYSRCYPLLYIQMLHRISIAKVVFISYIFSLQLDITSTNLLHTVLLDLEMLNLYSYCIFYLVEGYH